MRPWESWVTATAASAATSHQAQRYPPRADCPRARAAVAKKTIMMFCVM